MGGLARGFCVQHETAVIRHGGLAAMSTRFHLIAHLQSWLCVPVWRWCPRCIPSGWGTCLASWGCSGSRWGCGSCAHTQLDMNTERHRKHTHRKDVNIVVVQEKIRGNGKGNRKERNKRAKREWKDFKETCPGQEFRGNFTWKHGLHDRFNVFVSAAAENQTSVPVENSGNLQTVINLNMPNKLFKPKG